MGTNYYLQRKHPETGRCADVHICKTSGGWTPSMVGYKNEVNHYDLNVFNEKDIPEILTWVDWKVFLLQEIAKGGLIFNEYDEPQTYQEFVVIIEGWQIAGEKENHRNHAREVLYNGLDPTYWQKEDLHKYYWIDDKGFSFSAMEFS